jgi:hypothetical protein
MSCISVKCDVELQDYAIRTSAVLNFHEFPDIHLSLRIPFQHGVWLFRDHALGAGVGEPISNDFRRRYCILAVMTDFCCYHSPVVDFAVECRRGFVVVIYGSLGRWFRPCLWWIQIHLVL